MVAFQFGDFLLDFSDGWLFAVALFLPEWFRKTPQRGIAGAHLQMPKCLLTGILGVWWVEKLGSQSLDFVILLLITPDIED